MFQPSQPIVDPNAKPDAKTEDEKKAPAPAEPAEEVGSAEESEEVSEYDYSPQKSGFTVGNFGRAPVTNLGKFDCSAIKTFDAMVNSLPAPKKKKKKKAKKKDDGDESPARPASPGPEAAAGGESSPKKKRKKSHKKKVEEVVPEEPVLDMNVDEAQKGATSWNNVY
jgi:hypothetical protein